MGGTSKHLIGLNEPKEVETQPMEKISEKGQTKEASEKPCLPKLT